MIHTLFSWSPARSLQAAFDELSEEETILKQGLAHVQMSQKHQSFSRSKIPAETQYLAVQKKGTTCKKLLWPRDLGRKPWGIFCNRQHLPGYCCVIFPAGHHQLDKAVPKDSCVSHAARAVLQPETASAAHSPCRKGSGGMCCPTASCALMCATTAGWHAGGWRGAPSSTVFLLGSVMWNCFQISCSDSFVWLGVF